MSFEYEKVLCPDCGFEMISRTGKFGIFWGCKQYPKCKGTRDSLGRSKADRAREKGEDESEIMGLAEEINNHDLKEGNKSSFKKNWNVK